MKVLEDSSLRNLVILPVIVLIFASAVVATYRPPAASAASGSPSMGMVIPLYTYPTDGTWTQVIQARQAYPNVPILAIINPNSGPGSSLDSNYVQGIKNLQGAGVTVLGYVDTAYAGDSISSVESNVNLYKSWYAVNGIMFDDMSNLATDAPYYATLGSYVHSDGMTVSMGNPGTSVPTVFIGGLDILCVYESTGLPALSFITYPGFSPSNFAVVALDVPLSSSFLTSASTLVSWVYLTDASGSNPYDVLPSYLTSELATLSSIDGTQSTTSSTTSQSSTATTTKLTTSTTTTSSTTASSTTTTSGGVPTAAVNSVDLTGAALPGLWSTWNQGSNVLATGYTPVTFDGTSGGTYVAMVADYSNFVFCHWEDGSTTASRSVTFGPSVSLTAYYSTNGSCPTGPSTVAVQIASDYFNGTSLQGIQGAVTSGTSTVASGTTPFTFSAVVGNSYTVTVQNSGSFVFDHWSVG
ncbi:MAG TPA: spherulation-specific family 4 protein, partial [Nitrososphaerales archaeon]|nr:spherulation-specific family 4 protein [Nitrososphaerales archaeon]